MFLLLLLSLQPQAPPETPLDARRRQLLEVADAFYRLGPEDPALPRPNRTLRGQDDRGYLEAALAIFARVELGMAPDGQTATANALLRYSLHKWPATEPPHVLGQYARAWNHRGRSLASRIWGYYRSRLEPDIRDQFVQRWRFMLVEPSPRSSENIKTTGNVAIFLAHEFLAETERPTYAAGRAWLLDQMRLFLDQGLHEWGSTYPCWTIGALLNLVDFSTDAELRELALRCVDQYTVELAAFRQGPYFCAGAVRRYPHWLLGYLPPQTTILQTLWFGDPEPSWDAWIEWAVTDWRPLREVERLATLPVPYEAALTSGPHNYRHRVWVGQGVSIATQQALGRADFVEPSGGTHDIAGCFIQSARGSRAQVVPFGHWPDRGGSKRRNQTERYFGWQNVAFVQHGGVTRSVWAAGQTEGAPIRLFYANGFEPVIEGGWAFVSDGTAHVAWCPTIGEPVPETELDDYLGDFGLGRMLRSTHVPGPEGETAVVEVGDRLSHADLAAFRRDILTRAPRPRWADGKVAWPARDGTLLEFSDSGVTMNGQAYDPATMPRFTAPGLTGLVDSAGERLPGTLRFGTR